MIETLPLPECVLYELGRTDKCDEAVRQPVADAGRMLLEHRQRTMNESKESLTRFLNRIHDPSELTVDADRFRELLRTVDYELLMAYGFADLTLEHQHVETTDGVRYTISESGRREVLARLLKLNHERYAEEVKQGLHEKKKPKSTRGKKKAEAADTGRTLFGEDD